MSRSVGFSAIVDEFSKIVSRGSIVAGGLCCKAADYYNKAQKRGALKCENEMLKAAVISFGVGMLFSGNPFVATANGALSAMATLVHSYAGPLCKELANKELAKGMTKKLYPFVTEQCQNLVTIAVVIVAAVMFKHLRGAHVAATLMVNMAYTGLRHYDVLKDLPKLEGELFASLQNKAESFCPFFGCSAQKRPFVIL